MSDIEEFQGAIYTGEPDDLPRSRGGVQDDLAEGIRDTLTSLAATTQRDTAGTLEWYKRWATSPPFDPDGMCLKVCRTARNIDAVFPSALAAQEATPTKYRVSRVSEIRKGMVMYFDDPNDSNPFGHIVTVAGRAAGVAWTSLNSLVVWTNSVKADQLVAVRADYFPTRWGDRFQFAATWLNGVELRMDAAAPARLGSTFKHAIEDLEKARAHHKARGHTRIVNALTRDLEELRESLKTING